MVTREDGREELVFVQLRPVSREQLEALRFAQQAQQERRAQFERLTLNRNQRLSPLRRAANLDQVIARSIEDSNGNGTLIHLKGRQYQIVTQSIPDPKRPINGNSRRSGETRRLNQRATTTTSLPSCTAFERRVIDQQFEELFSVVSTVRDRRHNPTLMFPLGMETTQQSIASYCVAFRAAASKIATTDNGITDASSLYRCSPSYNRLGEVMASLQIPCLLPSHYSFNRYYDCIRGTIHNTTMQSCLAAARGQIIDPFVDHCDAYQILAECVHPTVNYACGKRAWEVQFNYLAVNVRQAYLQTMQTKVIIHCCFRYYDCIRGTIHNTTMQSCLAAARGQIIDPFVDHCDAYQILAECVYPTVNYACGKRAWEVQFNYLAVNVRQRYPQCRLERF